MTQLFQTANKGNMIETEPDLTTWYVLHDGEIHPEDLKDGYEKMTPLLGTNEEKMYEEFIQGNNKRVFHSTTLYLTKLEEVTPEQAGSLNDNLEGVVESEFAGFKTMVFAHSIPFDLDEFLKGLGD